MKTFAVSAATVLSLALAPGRLSAQKTPTPRETKVTLDVTAAIVLGDLTVRPVPLLALELIPDADTTLRISFRTSLAGKAVQSVPAGKYHLRSPNGAQVASTQYKWDVPLDISAPSATVELTNDNAGHKEVAVALSRQIAPEREVYERARRGVFRVEAGLGHGTGFLIGEHGGLVVTNDHVVANSTTASVQLDSVTRVPAQVVARDREADLAVLRMAPGRCAECPRLTLAQRKPGEALVVAGERVLAIGFPLNQEMTLTSGIASSIRAGAIISDVNINHGNSGGPLMNLAGEVVAVNAFGDFTAQGGPGISGSISIEKLWPLLSKIPSALQDLPPVADRLLPTMPLQTYPLSLLNAIADTGSLEGYQWALKRDAGNFQLSFTTPVVQKILQKTVENDVGKDRKKREARGNVAQDERYNEISQSRDWEQYVGDAAAPVITVSIIPKIGETGGSIFARALEQGLTGYSTAAATMRFKGDVRGVRFYRNGVEVEPIRGGHGAQTVMVDNRWVQLKDVADMGYFVLPPTLFQPDSAGTPARVFIAIQDLKNPYSMATLEVYDETSARLWNDFLPYLEWRSGGRVSAADLEGRSPKLKMDCDPTDGRCTPRRK